MHVLATRKSRSSEQAIGQASGCRDAAGQALKPGYYCRGFQRRYHEDGHGRCRKSGSYLRGTPKGSQHHAPKLTVASNNSQESSLSLASREGRLETVRLLLEQGADVNYVDSNGLTPLHEASAQGHHDIVQLLLEHETDVLTRNNADQTFLDVAWANGHKEIIDVDARYSEDQTVLHVAAQHGDPEFMHWLIVDRGVQPDIEDENMETPLFPVTRNGRLEATRLLLEHGADVDHRDWQKRTPLHGASENGHHDVGQLLLDYKAEVDAQNVYQWAPLHLASRTGMCAAAQVLIEGGAKLDARNDFCWTPLHMASQKGHLEVVELLLSRGADVDIQEAADETALHLASYYGHLGAVKALLKHNADRRIPNKEGKTPLDLAMKEGHQEIVQTLSRAVEKVESLRATRMQRGKSEKAMRPGRKENKTDSYMQSLEHPHSSLSQSHPERPLFLHQLAADHFKHDGLSDRQEDLDETIYLLINNISLPLVHPTRNEIQTLLELSFARLHRLKKYGFGEPDEVNSTIKCLWELHDCSLEAFDVPHNAVTASLVEMLAFRVGRESGNVVEDIHEIGRAHV